MADLGDPTSYLQIEDGVPVLSSDGQEIGRLEHVLADEATDIFDGIIIDTRTGPGGWRFADASEVDSMHEDGITLTLSAAEAEHLPEPSENPPAMGTDPADIAEPDGLGDKLRRAWDYISGNY
jgi:hypothetical protein